MRVLICGGGVIGASIAYFLSCRGVDATVIERTELGCAASGRAGGFLALDWCDGTPLQPLARRSFVLHAQLAEEIGTDWGYRRLTTYGGFVGSRRHSHAYNIDWLATKVSVHQRLGSTETTAQVHPKKFTAAMMKAAERRGATLRLGRVTGIARDRSGAIRGAEVDGETVDGDAVVIAMGPWSLLAAQWLPVPAVYGLKGHSIVLETGPRIPAEAVFLELRETSGALQAPELFPRSDGTTYVCAISSESSLPVDPAEVAPDAGAVERLQTMCSELSPVFASAKVLARQACFRPITGDWLPLIGCVPGAEGAYIATGHSVWGILNAPATGEAMAELIVDGAAHTVDLSSFDPARLPPLDPARLHGMVEADQRQR